MLLTLEKKIRWLTGVFDKERGSLRNQEACNSVCTSAEASSFSIGDYVNVTSLRGVDATQHARTRGHPPRTSPCGRECTAHYEIMGYFDPPRITESTMRDSIRKSLAAVPAVASLLSA